MSKHLFLLCTAASLACSTALLGHQDEENSQHIIVTNEDTKSPDATEILFEKELMACAECGGVCAEGDAECVKNRENPSIANADDSDKQEGPTVA